MPMLPYLVPLGDPEMMHDMASLLFLCHFPDLITDRTKLLVVVLK